jgi:hypothetical protein
VHVVTKPIVLTRQAYWGETTGWTQAHAERKLQEFIDEFDRYDAPRPRNKCNAKLARSCLDRADFEVTFRTAVANSFL